MDGWRGIFALSLILPMVGTARCAVTARKARGTARDTTSDYARCAATRGADSAARCPYHGWIGG
jgi:hypothetical protein